MSHDFFASTRGRALKFPEGAHGTTHVLFITRPVEMEPQKEGDEQLYWDAERTRPRMQAVVTGYVTEGLSGPRDDGFRSLYVRGGIQKAVSAACRRAGVAQPGPGMILTLEYTHDGTQPDPDRRPPKQYHADLEIVPDWDNDPRFTGAAAASRMDGCPDAVGGMVPEETSH